MESVNDELSRLLPTMNDSFYEATQQSALLVVWFLKANALQAANVIANQATNDFHDLLDDLARGPGRPATRAARALVEHAINLRSVAQDPDSAARYLAHGAIAAQVEAAAEIGLSWLKGPAPKAERHRLWKLKRDSAKEAGQATAAYRSSFARTWAKMNLHDRAKAMGLGHLYAYYRLSSNCLHGAFGGSTGTLSVQYTRPVHRTGPNLYPVLTRITKQ